MEGMDVELITVGQGNLLPVHANGIPQSWRILQVYCIVLHCIALYCMGLKFTIPGFLCFYFFWGGKEIYGYYFWGVFFW